MRHWPALLLLLLMCGATQSTAQEKTPAPIETLPSILPPAPIEVPTAPVEHIGELPHGIAVSQPLNQVQSTSDIPTVMPPAVPAESLLPDDAITIPAETAPDLKPAIADRWYGGEFLLMWSNAGRLPPLATTNDAGRLPILGDPNTRVLIGGETRKVYETAGAAFTWGWSVGKSTTTGFEIGFQTLGTSTMVQTVSGGGLGGRVLGRPLISDSRGTEDVVLISHEAMLGDLDVAVSSRAQGWQVATIMNLVNREPFKLHMLAGYRYFQLNEGLRVDQYSLYNAQFGNDTTPVRHRSLSADQLDAHNRFHGALLGLRSEIEVGRYYLQCDAKVSLGHVTQMAKISGQTVTTVDRNLGTEVYYYQSGVLGQATNTGRLVQSRFGVLPEALVKFGYRLGENGRFFLSYHFSYLNPVIRPGDLVDRTVFLPDPSDAYLLRLPSSRPMVQFQESSYWLQGLGIGLEWRY
jgi:hypothetical protein